MKRTLAASLLLAASITGSVNAAAPVGWACYAAGGNVYRVKVGGSPQALATGVSADHACFSRDGSLIFYQDGASIYVMNNDGSGRRSLTTGTSITYNGICAYRPEPTSVMFVKNGDFYKINAANGESAQKVADCNVSIVGEMAISQDGTRVAFRSGNTSGGRLKKMTVGSNAVGYEDNCSASVSANGGYLTENQSGHTQLKVLNWAETSTTTLNAGTIGHWDNQSFAVNSSDWIVALDDDPTTNDNKGTGIGVVNRSNQAYMVASWSGSYTMYPSFFVGELPSTTTPTYTLTVTSGSGDGSYTQGTVVSISANTPPTDKMFHQWTGDVTNVANVSSAQTTITMPAADATVTATYADIPVDQFALTVNGGTGSGSYAAGTEVTITADTPSPGSVFTGWTGDVSALADASSAQATVTMPAADVTVTASFSGATATAITSHLDGCELQEGSTVTLEAEGSNVSWSYDANSDGLGAVPIGEGNSVDFEVPTGVTGPRTIDITAAGDNGTATLSALIVSGAVYVLGRSYNGPADYFTAGYSGLQQNTVVRFAVQDVQQVQVRILDMTGRLAASLAEGTYGPGLHTVTLNDGRLKNGLYTVELRAGGSSRHAVLRVVR